jgi:hypothetical protein
MNPALPRSGEGWTAKCPAHKDKQNSLSVHHRDGKWLLKCHAGCDWKEIIAAIGAEEMEHGWRCIPIPPTDEDGWFVVDDSSDRKTTWGRWRPGDGGEPSP